MKTSFKRYFSMLMIISLVFTFIFSSSVFAANSGTPSGANAPQPVKFTFPDVALSYWGQKYISKLALLGVVTGDGQGKYNAAKEVTQQDVVLMAIKLMGLKDEVNTNADVVLPFDVSAYAKPYVILAIDKGILKIQEELSTLVGGQLLNSWGTKPATREWAAKITIRAIGKQDLADNLANQSADFPDRASITPAMLGYINAAVQLRIVNGLPDGTFDPKGTVNRAQIAAFFSNAENHLSKRSDLLVNGLLTEIKNQQISVQDSNGAVKTYVIHNNMLVYEKDKVSLKLPSDLKLYSLISLIQVQGTAYYVEILKDKVEMESISGKLVEKSIEQMEIRLQVDGKEVSYELASDVSVIDKDGNGSSLAALILNSMVEIKRSIGAEQPKVIHITIKEVPVSKIADGTIDKIDASTLVVLNNQTQTTETFPLSSNLTITYGTKTLSTVNELKKGDMITYRVENGFVASIELTKPSIKLLQGSLDELDISKKRLIIRNTENLLQVYEMANDYDISIDGMSWATLNDLIIGDSVALGINENNNIEKITVLNRNIQEGVIATIVYYDSAAQKIWTRDEAGTDKILKVTDNTMLLTDSTAPTLANFSNLYPNGKKIFLTLSGEQIISIELANKINGVITQINSQSTQKSIVLKTDKNVMYTFALDTGVSVEVLNKTYSYLSDLSEGDSVRIVLNSAQDKVSQILLTQSKLFRVVSKDAAYRRLTVKDEAGTSAVLNVYANIPITLATGEVKSFDNIPLDEPIVVSYVGKTISKAVMGTIIRGKAASVDAANKSLTVTDFNNANQVVQTSSNVTVYRGTSKSTGLGTVAVNDRLEVVTGADGIQFITVISAVQKTYWRSTQQPKEVTFKRTSLLEKNGFLFHPNAYLHQGTRRIELSELKEDDKVTIYVLNDKIIELEK